MTARLAELQFGSSRRLPVVLQIEKAECALACLSMVASFHGANIDIEQLRSRFSVSLKGTTLDQVMQLASALGLESRAVRLELEHLDRLRAPCILHWNLNHFVVLKKVARNRIVIHDPASGVRTLTREEVSAAFTGVALELWPSPSFEKSERSTPRVRIRDLVGKVSGIRRAVSQILLVALALEVFAVLNPLVFQLVFDHVIVSAGVELLLVGALGFAIATVIQQLIRWLRAWMLMRFSTELSLQWRSNVFSLLLRLPVSYFEKRQLGDLATRFGSVERIQQAVTTAFLEGILDGGMALLTLVILFIYSPVLALIVVGSIAMVLLAMMFWYGARFEASRKQLVFNAAQHTHFLESMRGIRSIKLFQRESTRIMSWSRALTREINAGLSVTRMDVLFNLQRGLIMSLQSIVILAVGAYAVIDGHMTAGMLLTFVVYKHLFESRVIEFIDKVVQLRMLRIEGERLWDIVGQKPESSAEAAPRLEPVAASTAAIEVRSLRFRYGENEPYVLNGVSFDIAPGEFVAITGPSGCGKSTLVNLMLGIHPPTEGEIIVAGTNSRRDGFAAMRRITGTVMQDDSLYAGSLAENICFFANEPDQEWIEHCARLAAIHDEIQSMPMKYQTMIGDMGSALSGGQKQRILLARALYKRPSILILDEATSHLDVERERAVNAALRQLCLTRVVIAHRPETIAAADRHIELGSGGILRDSSVLRVASVG